MATLAAGEIIIDAIIAKLQSGLAARVAVINAEDTQGVTLTVPGTDDYFLGGTPLIARAPSIIVTQTPSDIEYEAEGPHSFIWVGDFLIAIVDDDYDRQRLGRRLSRWGRAVREVLWDDAPQEALTDAAHHLRLIKDDPGPVQDPENDASAWRHMHLVQVRCWRHEG